MDVKNPGLIKDGKVDWQMFEDLLVNNPTKYMGEIFSLDEMKVIYSVANSKEYYLHLGAALNRRKF